MLPRTVPGRRRRIRPRAASPSPCTGAARRCSRSSRSPPGDLGEPPDPVGPELERRRPRSRAAPGTAREAGIGAGQDLLEIRRPTANRARRGSGSAPAAPGSGPRAWQVERAARDEQDVIGLHHAVLGRDGRALDQRQQVALHALARNVCAPRSRRGSRSCRFRRETRCRSARRSRAPWRADPPR